MPLIRKMEKNLWKVRSNISSGIARVFFTVKGALMILLHGFVKKSDKTPPNELNTARRRLNDIEKE
jgi:phage-related protein